MEESRNILKDNHFLLSELYNSNKVVFKYIFDEYYHKLYIIAYKYLHDSTQAEDIVQDVMLYLWENRKHLTIHSSLGAYLAKTTVNKSLNLIKKQYVKARLIENQEIITLLPKNEVMDDLHLKTTIRNAINRLPERCRIIFKLSKNFDYTYKEIAEFLGISTNTVENQMSIALKKIRASLNKDTF
jgi:RNA polymerase sigma-70 factor (ECF subfamily)